MQNNTYTILSIDPGYDRCGVALIGVTHNNGTLMHSECIRTSKNDPQEKRLSVIYTQLEKIVAQYTPTHIALETLFFSVNKKTALKVAEARGIVLLLAGNHSLPVIELSPQAVKLSITGIGNSDKKAVQKMVSLILKVDTTKKIDDEIDAIALGFAAIGSMHRSH